MNVFLILLVAYGVFSSSSRALGVDRGPILTNVNPGSVIRQVDKKVYFLQAEVAPLTAILTQTGAMKKMFGPLYEWYEKDMGTPLCTALNASAIGSATIVVAAGQGTSFCINDIIEHRVTSGVAGAQHLVTNVVGDTLTVTRAIGLAGGGVADANIAAGDTIMLIAPAFPENGLSQRAISLTPNVRQNCDQTFRHFAEISRKEAETERYDIGMPRMAERRKEAIIFHMEARERAYFFGQYLYVAGTSTQNAGRGIRQTITTNVFNLLGALTKAKLDAIAEQVTLYGPGKKDFHCSGSLMRAIHTEILGLGSTHLNLSPDSEKYGLKIYEYVTPFGTLNLILNRMLTQCADGEGYIIDRDNIRRFGQTDTIIKHNIQPPDQDGFKDEVLTDDHIQLTLEPKHARVYNP